MYTCSKDDVGDEESRGRFVRGGNVALEASATVVNHGSNGEPWIIFVSSPLLPEATIWRVGTNDTDT